MPYTTRKLKAGDYSELDALVLLPATDGVHSWIPAAAVKDPKSSITRDENLTWEEFNKVALWMISSMKIHDWPEDRVDMHVQFWSALQTHCWCHALDQLKQ
ncbi:hypothetical protein DFH29DRAFT_215429 [Suillus ampliporus]|nr:hypothetical protein DFH29DRAFT_215429 [Suillus ampliporus]